MRKFLRAILYPVTLLGYLLCALGFACHRIVPNKSSGEKKISPG